MHQHPPSNPMQSENQLEPRVSILDTYSWPQCTLFTHRVLIHAQYTFLPVKGFGILAPRCILMHGGECHKRIPCTMESQLSWAISRSTMDSQPDGGKTPRHWCRSDPYLTIGSISEYSATSTGVPYQFLRIVATRWCWSTSRILKCDHVSPLRSFYRT